MYSIVLDDILNLNYFYAGYRPSVCDYASIGVGPRQTVEEQLFKFTEKNSLLVNISSGHSDILKMIHKSGLIES